MNFDAGMTHKKGLGLGYLPDPFETTTTLQHDLAGVSKNKVVNQSCLPDIKCSAQENDIKVVLCYFAVDNIKGIGIVELNEIQTHFYVQAIVSCLSLPRCYDFLSLQQALSL